MKWARFLFRGKVALPCVGLFECTHLNTASDDGSASFPCKSSLMLAAKRYQIRVWIDQELATNYYNITLHSLWSTHLGVWLRDKFRTSILCFSRGRCRRTEMYWQTVRGERKLNSPFIATVILWKWHRRCMHSILCIYMDRTLVCMNQKHSEQEEPRHRHRGGS